MRMRRRGETRGRRRRKRREKQTEKTLDSTLPFFGLWYFCLCPNKKQHCSILKLFPTLSSSSFIHTHTHMNTKHTQTHTSTSGSHSKNSGANSSVISQPLLAFKQPILINRQLTSWQVPSLSEHQGVSSM